MTLSAEDLKRIAEATISENQSVLAALSKGEEDGQPLISDKDSQEK